MTINDPRDIPGLVAWYSAEAETGYLDNQNMAIWHDLSGNGNHTDNKGTDFPKWRAASGPSGAPCIDFGTASGPWTLPDLMSGATEGEIFAWTISTAPGFPHGLWDFGTSPNDDHYPFSDNLAYSQFGTTVRKNSINVGVNAADIMSWHRLNIWSAPSDWSMQVNEVTKHSTATNTVGWDTSPRIGLTGFTISQSCIILYDRKLTSGERADLVTWMQANPGGGVPAQGPFNDPRDIPGLLVWYSACNEAENYYADGDEMPTLHDLSGNGYDATSPNVTPNQPRMDYTGGEVGDACIDSGPATGKGHLIPQAAFLATSSLYGSTSLLNVYTYGAARGPLGAWDSGDQFYVSPPDDVYSEYCSNNQFGPIDPVVTVINEWRKLTWKSLQNQWNMAVDGSLIYQLNVGNVYNNAPTSIMGTGAFLGGITDALKPNGFLFGGYYLFDHVLTAYEQAFMDQWMEDFPCGGMPFVPVVAPPTNLEVDPACTTATVGWDAAEDDPDGYEVRLNGGAETDIGDVLTYTFTGLSEGTTYNAPGAEVRAYKDSVFSVWVAVPFTTDSIPGSPTGVAATASTSSVTVTWTAVPGATGYRVRLNGGTPVNAGNVTSYAFTGLASNTTYTIEVQAYNSCGTSDWVEATGSPITTPNQIVASPCPCNENWVIESCDLATGRVRAILQPTAAEWQTILIGLGTGTLTLPTRNTHLRDIWPDLTSIYISRITDTGEYDCQYAGIIEKVTAKSTLDGGTVSVGMQPLENYWWRRFIDVDRSYTNQPQTQIAASLTSYALADGIPLSGVAEASVVNRDRLYVGAERPFIGAQLDLLAQAEDGIEWTLLHTRTNGFWSTRVLFQDRAGDDRPDILRGDVEGSEYGVDIDAKDHSTYVDGSAEDLAGTKMIANAQDTGGPYVRFDSAPTFGTLGSLAETQEQSTGYLIDHREPVASPAFTLVGDTPLPEDLRLGDTAEFHIAQGAVTFHGRARVAAISWSLSEGKPLTRVLGLLPVDRASDSVLNQ